MFLSSYHIGRNEEIEKIKKWTFVFPECDIDTLHSKGEKLLSHRIDNGEYKFIIYSDSTNCTGCQMKNNGLWYSVIRYVEEKKINMSFYFIYSPSFNDYKKIKSSYELSHFIYPIFVDKNGNFLKKNPFLQNRVYNCFVIDKNNKILFVGNPTINIKTEERFMRFIDYISANEHKKQKTKKPA